MKLFRISNILSFLCATICGVLLFWTSQAVQKKADILDELKSQLEREQDSIKVLAVEWDYLNRPQRLEKIAKEQLGMALPTSGGVAKSIDDIPEPVYADAPDINNENMMMPVSNVVASKPIQDKTVIVITKENIAPKAADKQSFERLIESLDDQNGDAP